jgi:hypothetical protein
MYDLHISFNLNFFPHFFRENNQIDFDQEEQYEEDEDDINLEDKSDFEKQQIHVNIIFLLLLIHLIHFS